MKYVKCLLTIGTLVAGLGQTAFAAKAPQERSSLASDECTVCIVGNPVVQWRGTSGSIHVPRVENRGPSPTMSLGLQVELQSTRPEPGDFCVGEYRISDLVRLDPLPPGGAHSNIDSGTITFDGSDVPAGEYFMVVNLVTNLDTSWVWLIDYVLMNDKVTCDGSGCKVGRPCSTARIAGDWGYTKTGTLILPTGATPFATLGILNLSPDGTLTGVNTGSVGGKVGEDVLNGTFQMNPDCTGTTTVEVHDKSSGALLRTIGMNLVVDEDETHMRGIVTSLVLPNGVSLPAVVTADSRRVSGKSDSAK